MADATSRPTTLLLLRHGLTDAVVSGTLTGTSPGVRLNAEGKRQAAALADGLAGIPLSAVVSSPLERAVETAAPIAERHTLSIETDSRLLEFEFGEWSGKTFDQLDADGRWQQFNRLRSIAGAPGGETMLDVQTRAVRAVLDAADRHAGGVAAVVTHGDVIRAVLMHFLGIPLDFVHRLEVLPASISIVEIADGVPRVRLINGDTAAGRL